MSRNWNDHDFDSFDKKRNTAKGRKSDRREKRHDSKTHLRDLKDMANGGEDIEVDDIIRDLETEE